MCAASRSKPRARSSTGSRASGPPSPPSRRPWTPCSSAEAEEDSAMHFLSEPEFWVAVAFVLFIGVLVKAGAPRVIIGALDDRRGRIKAELDEARRVREEAQALLAEYQRKRQEADREADSIIEAARAEAERAAADAKTKAEEFVTRRTKMAETKIAQAEAQ